MSNNTILIIDDDQVTTAVIEEYLVDFGLKVITAQNGDEGIEVMRKSNPDLILLDIMMPGKDGIQILKEIKLTPGLSNTPILLLSSVDRTNIKVKGLELGADDYITKPVDKAELLARIQLSLKRSSKDKKDPGILEGELSNFSLADLLQSFEMGKKTATILFPDMDGEIIIKNGAMIKSRQGLFTKTKAVNRIFFLETGKFIVKFNKINDHTDNDDLNITSLLMSNISYIDEVRLMQKSISNDPEGIRVTQEFKDLTGLDIIESDKLTNINDIIVKMEGSLKENVESLIQINKNFPHIVKNEH
ncbi:MAG: response regulator [Candidatus Aminicenantes bacterium]|nr:response regulator [Candidatus Aminicenantes bacterium]